jgi:uncharacterized protein (DUF1499 family)
MTLHHLRFLRRLLPLLALLLALALPTLPARASLLHLEGPVPEGLGVRQGHLSGCPSPAHCARQDWPVTDPDAALAALMPAVLSLDGVDVVETRDGYLHATVTSRLFGFVDDLELYANRREGLLEARSESRLGDSDLGVNGRRLGRLRDALSAA